jgi:hypothetical protein
MEKFSILLKLKSCLRSKTIGNMAMCNYTNQSNTIVGKVELYVRTKRLEYIYIVNGGPCEATTHECAWKFAWDQSPKFAEQLVIARTWLGSFYFGKPKAPKILELIFTTEWLGTPWMIQTLQCKGISLMFYSEIYRHWNSKINCWISPVIPTRANTMLKLMEAIAIPYCVIALPTIFDMNLMEVWQSLHTRRFFVMQSGVPGGVLMSPNAMANFSLWWHNWSNFSSSSTSCKTNFVSGTYPASCICADNLFNSVWNSSIWGCSWSSTTNTCTSPFTSIQEQAGCFFTPFSILCHCTFGHSSHFPEAV